VIATISGSRLDHLENLRTNASGPTLTVQSLEKRLCGFGEITPLGSSLGPGFVHGRIPEILASLLRSL
jgi:hypothetical protein